jgi:pimeloyl-ACP methyl ester carboxylesterase
VTRARVDRPSVAIVAGLGRRPRRPRERRNERWMYFVRRGERGPLVVFIHGFGCTHDDWNRQVAELQNRAATIAVDLPGHGRTPGTVAECTIETFAADVAGLVTALGFAPAVLVAHSMGCRVALEVSRTAPRQVAGLVLIEGSRFGGPGSDACRVLAQRIADVGYEAFVRGFIAGMFLATSDRALVERTIQRALRLPADLGAPLVLNVARWDADRLDEALAHVQVPLLAIQSTHLTPANVHLPLRTGQTTPYLDLMRARVTDCAIRVVEGVGHFAQLEAPDQVTSYLLDFLTQHGGA